MGVSYLLDTSVVMDVLNGRQDRGEILERWIDQDILLACCSINVTEIYMGMRPDEEERTTRFLQSLEFYPVTWDIARRAGDLFRDWRERGQTLALSDVTIAAVALTHKLVLVTDNRKHFPMAELRLQLLP